MIKMSQWIRIKHVALRSGKISQHQTFRLFCSQMNTRERENFVECTRPTRLPYTNEDAGKILLNWTFIHGHPFLMDLRKTYVIYGKLSEKQMEAIRNTLTSTSSNKLFVCCDSFFLQL